ncbi:hypothetical protein AB0I16_24540 [Streptomyces sp. NPDC050703]|uniref:hypothetical protein n=1 Tax=Streptomyces sp. NPDC050703 TaxID=3157218 RepID=UPI00343937F9
MKSQVNIIAVVDVIGALSIRGLHDGNLCMVDDGPFDSSHQGTADLVTIVKPGQVVSWTALAVDLQTPVEIKNISFAPSNGHASHDGSHAGPAYAGQAQAGRAQAGQSHGTGGGAEPLRGTATAAAPGMGVAVPGPGVRAPGAQGQGAYGREAHGEQDTAGEKLDLDVWTGVVPHWMTPGVPYQYRIEFQMYEGAHSVMHVETPALMCQ